MSQLGLSALMYLKRQRRRVSRWSNRRKNPVPIYSVPRPLPKRIWFFWAQGLDDAPELVRTCASSWTARNPGWTIHVLRQQDLPEYIDVGDVPDDVSMNHLADIARVRLLRKYGGVWADATVYCSRPLDEWLPPLMQSGFFAFARPGPDRAIASWFLASEREGSIISTWDSNTRSYWENRKKPGSYFWVHDLFELSASYDTAFRRIWNNTPKVSADGPHFIVRQLGSGLLPPTDLKYDVSAIPLHKLNWKMSFDTADLRRWGIVPVAISSRGAAPSEGVD
jgi:hypothetical protein